MFPKEIYVARVEMDGEEPFFSILDSLDEADNDQDVAIYKRVRQGHVEQTTEFIENKKGKRNKRRPRLHDLDVDFDIDAEENDERYGDYDQDE